jgi:hypothetical protein
MNKTNQSFIAKVKTYLKKSELPYIRIKDTENILVMRSAGDYHYMLVQFFDMPTGWMKTQRYFKFKVVKPTDYNHIIKSITKYTESSK